MNTWNIIIEGFNKADITKHESIFSLGNGAMGMRANFEEDYTGDTLQGSYIGGVYYPDKTRVGWWKNGYPEYFAKVLNAPSWIGLHIKINGELLDLNTCLEVKNFRRQLNMKEGWYERSFTAMLPNQQEIQVKVLRFLSLRYDELGALRYEITPLTTEATIEIESYLDSGIKNSDANWDERFWNTLEISSEDNFATILAETKKTGFKVHTFMQNQLFIDNKALNISPKENKKENYIGLQYEVKVKQNQTFCIEKYGGYSRSNDCSTLSKSIALFDSLLENQREDWATIWETSDIVIEGDEKAQQGIRFNIFQLNQTYSGKYAHLNIGPKGFTGEKYGGSTYWDTEAYCLPFYMATKGAEVARNLLMYRYNQLDKAIENAQKLGFTGGAALYPMVTMNGEECHNEWEITFEEIHRNGAIAFAIYNYTRYTGDESYIKDYGIEVLIAIARFWAQRISFSAEKQKYVILGVTGPNEYENNINNNFYTNYLASWCLCYAAEQVTTLQKEDITKEETQQWLHIAQNIYFPYSEKYGVYLQQDGFLDKDLKPVTAIPAEERPLNQHWSWDRILRSPYIKQADTLQGFYFFEDHFTKEELQKHYEFYEPFTVHESSLSPCVHSVLASALGKIDEAYTLYLRTARLDLDDYNKEVHEGLHITSMAGTWLSIVKGFAGMRVKNGELHFTPRLPKHWKSLSFKVIFQGKTKEIKL
ncbi:family 65 glycosyl hydrolase domain-containing protein [Capnocytophaga sputigena]|uniref:Family 65 glycosyl hydrolase n=1 Tax=Capnocytophaga sputigena TaxID=1019 RepID=A0AAX2IB66_CAPSP|nr:family 65 glycosyl hydrolase domain-containing protein [Capnocytophaga sputigena]ATA84543.1 family 65 glycosyl hydrolase [Capnocytophaga sputigena]EEB66620.1 glycosyl hydrolase family 65 central catalytic domain protein [Capnocytophaga sputigena ATCC 33612]SQA75682.1 Kojibiose phosphorylase [Capnocytophaga sputigena]